MSDLPSIQRQLDLIAQRIDALGAGLDDDEFDDDGEADLGPTNVYGTPINPPPPGELTLADVAKMTAQQCADRWDEVEPLLALAFTRPGDFKPPAPGMLAFGDLKMMSMQQIAERQAEVDDLLRRGPNGK